MANYNHKVTYNKKPKDGGAKYNSAPFVLELFLHDGLIVKDALKFDVATFWLSEKANVSDSYQLNCDYKLSGKISLKESDLRYEALFDVFESMNLLESLVESYADLKTKDEFNMFERNVEQLNQIFATDKMNFKEKADVNALIQAIDEMGYSEQSKFLADYLLNDTANFIDKEPQTAISDFYITKSPDGVYDIIMPFGLILDYSRTQIDFMPEAVDDSVTLAGADGEIVRDTVYRSRLFDLFAVSQDGLSVAEKEEIKAQIAKILNSIKKDTKTITFSERETTFDVKYTGIAQAKNKPGWVDFELPLKSASSYGHKQFVSKLKGSGLIENKGDKEVGVKITIKGECTNPSFTLGDRTFLWKGTVQNGEELVIDTDSLTCYLINRNGIRFNAMKNLEGDTDKKVPTGSLALSVPSEIENLVETEWQELVLY